MSVNYRDMRCRATPNTVSTYAYAEAVGVDPKTIADKCKTGKIMGAVKDRNGSWRIPVSAMPKSA